MRNYADYNHRKIPPTAAEYEAELETDGATCPVCGLIGMKIDMLPGEGVVCDICGIVPLEDPHAANYDDIAEARRANRFGTQL